MFRFLSLSLSLSSLSLSLSLSLPSLSSLFSLLSFSLSLFLSFSLSLFLSFSLSLFLSFSLSLSLLQFFLLPFAFCIWSLFEIFRLYFGYVGNADEKVPQLSAFVLSTIFPQIPLLLYLGYGQRAETVRFSYEVPLSTLLLLLCIFEVSVSYKALSKLISRQTASFFRLVQDDEDRLLETKEE